MDARSLLDELNKSDEHGRLEAKTARELGTSTLESVCAFANEPGLGGGFILLGAECDGEGRYVPAGVPDPDKVISDLSSACATTFNVPVRPRVRTDVVDGKVLIVVTVDEAPAGDKPIFFTKQGLPKGALRRIGSTDQRLTEDDLAAFYDHRRGTWFDNSPVTGATLADLDGSAIAEYRRLRGQLQPGASELRWSDDELLESLGAVVRQGANLVPTVAGIVVFGRPQALRRLFPMLRVDYVQVTGTEWASGPDGRFNTRELRGPAIMLVQELQQVIIEGMLKRVVVGDDQMSRREIPQLPAEVIREAVVNAVMHRSYRRQDPLMAVRYSNRVEILNPGVSLKHEDAFGSPGSVPRNPAIAMIFHETGLAETKGSGIRTMRDRMKSAGLSPPTLVSDRRDDRFTARFLFHHFLDEADIAWLSRFASQSLSSEEMAALIFVREVKAIDNLSYRQLTGADSASATASLRRLRVAGLLESFGRGPATFYRPTARVFDEEQGPSVPVASTGEVAKTSTGHHLPLPLTGEPSRTGSSLSQDPQSLSQELPPLSQDLPPLSQDLPPLSQDQMGTGSVSSAELPTDLADALAGLGRRSHPDRVRDTIVRICQHHAYRADELAQLMGRTASYVVRHYLTPLVEAGRLERVHPRMIHHPDQAYRAVSEPSQALEGSEPGTGKLST